MSDVSQRVDLMIVLPHSAVTTPERAKELITFSAQIHSFATTSGALNSRNTELYSWTQAKDDPIEYKLRHFNEQHC